MKWLSQQRTDWKDAIEEYDRKLTSGELQFDAKGDIISDRPQSQGWHEFLMSKLPPACFSRRR